MLRPLWRDGTLHFTQKLKKHPITSSSAKHTSHGLMRGEAVNVIRKDEQQEEFILC
jgi:hypothetical protein